MAVIEFGCIVPFLRAFEDIVSELQPGENLTDLQAKNCLRWPLRISQFPGKSAFVIEGSASSSH